MEPTDVTIEVLREIRDQAAQTNKRLEELNEGVDRLHRRQVATEVRLSTELIEVSQAVERVVDLLRDRLDLRDQVADHETRLTTIERHLDPQT